MTALAKLPEKWRAAAQALRDHPSYYVEIRSCGVAAAYDNCADELTAALSPAELGGVPEAVAIEPNGLVMRGGIAAIGDYAIEKSPGCTRIVNAEFARGWNEARAAMLSTPRAAEAVSEEVWRVIDDAAKLASGESFGHACDAVDWIREALAALTPPSAKGECHD